MLGRLPKRRTVQERFSVYCQFGGLSTKKTSDASGRTRNVTESNGHVFFSLNFSAVRRQSERINYDVFVTLSSTKTESNVVFTDVVVIEKAICIKDFLGRVCHARGLREKSKAPKTD